MKKKFILGIIVVVVVAGGLGVIKALQIRTIIAAAGAMVPPPETVATAVVQAEKWQDTLPAVGSVNAAQGVTVAPEIAGTVMKIAFESGATVNQGDLLVKLDTSTEEAQLRAAEAQVKLAKLNADRARQLRQDKTVSQSELDQAEAALQESQANADTIRATIDKKTIHAPFTGQLGIRLVNLGEQLDVGKGIVSLQALTPIYVDFSLPQQDLGRLQTGLKVRATSDSYPDKKFEGRLTAINPDLNATTRSIQLRAEFANPEKLLRPGMFVRVEVELPGNDNVLTIPATAVMSAPYGDAVYLVESSSTNGVTKLVARQKFIRTGRAKGDFISVEDGLKAGDRVVSSGLFKLRNGVSIQENNDAAPKPSLTPNPPNS